MKFAILGAGGIGCYYAARLINAGHSVLAIARGEHLQALQQKGLSLTHPELEYQAPLPATDTSGLMQNHDCDDFDLLIIAAKSTATRAMMEELHSWLKQGSTPVMSLQNGVTNEAIIAETVGRQRTIGGLGIRIGAHITAPGVVQATGEAHVDFGAWPNVEDNPSLQPWLQQLAALLRDAQIPNTLCDDVEYALWRKLILNNGVNPLTALTLMDTGAVTSDPVLRQNVYTMMMEGGRAARAAGVNIHDSDVREMFDVICHFDAIKTSMQVDREHGRTMETDDICGPVIEYCRQAGKPARVTELIRTLLLREVERDAASAQQ